MNRGTRLAKPTSRPASSNAGRDVQDVQQLRHMEILGLPLHICNNHQALPDPRGKTRRLSLRLPSIPGTREGGQALRAGRSPTPLRKRHAAALPLPRDSIVTSPAMAGQGRLATAHHIPVDDDKDLERRIPQHTRRRLRAATAPPPLPPSWRRPLGGRRGGEGEGSLTRGGRWPVRGGRGLRRDGSMVHPHARCPVLHLLLLQLRQGRDLFPRLAL